MSRDRLYYIENIFLLRVGNSVITIEEPVKWDTIYISIIFDEAARAYRFEFTDKDVLLEFDNAAGMAELEAEYYKNGSEGDASLKFCEKDEVSGTLTVLYEGSINFSSRIKGKNTVKYNCEKRSFGEKFRTYFDTKTDVFSTTSLGGTTLTPLTPTKLFMHPRQLTYVANFLYNFNLEASYVDPWDSSVNYTWLQRVRALGGKVYESVPFGIPNIGHEPSTSPSYWRLSTSFETTMTDEIIEGSGSDPHYKTVVPPFKQTSNNIPGFNEPTPPDGALIYSGLTLPEGVTKRSFYIDAKLSYQFQMGNTSQFITSGIVIFKRSGTSGMFPPIGADGYEETDEYLSFTNGGGNVAHTEVNNDIFLNGVIDLYANETLFIKGFVFTPDDAQFPITNFRWNKTQDFYLKVNEQTVYQASVVDALRIHEFVNRQFEIITDVINPLRSNFLGRTDLGYGSNGCPSNHYVLSGKMLRRLPNRAFVQSAKDIFTNLNALFCMGMSVERNDAGAESIRFEPIQYFFRDVLLYDVPSISKYFSRSDEKNLYNELEVGAQKFPQDNQPDSLDDFMTKFNGITPLTKVKNKLQIIWSWILSGNYIEYTRREGFVTNPNNAYETDEDTFLVSGTTPTEVIYGDVSVVFSTTENTATINRILPVIIGDRITISNGAFSNGVYTIIGIEIPFVYTKTILTLSENITTAGTTISTLLISEVRAFAKRDEDFDYVTGVSFPHSVYNLEHHIKRVALRWAKVFQSGWAMFIRNNVVKKVTFITGVNNTGVGTRLKDGAICSYGDSYGSPNHNTRYDKGADYTTQIDNPIFGNNVIDFETQISWETFNYICKAFEGRNPDGKDYGYLQWTNPEGKVEQGYITNAKLKPSTKVVKLTLREKYNP